MIIEVHGMWDQAIYTQATKTKPLKEKVKLNHSV
mgnify:CR=1 FL=1